MRLTTERNLETGTPPTPASRILILGDSTANAARTGAMAGAILEQLNTLAGLGGAVKLGNAGFGGYKLMDSSGSTRFLNFADRADAQGMTDTRTIMGHLGALDAAVVLLGANDLADIEPASGAVSGYDEAAVELGLTQLIANVRAENAVNGGSATIPVVLVIPGRDRSTGKRGGGQIWRQAVVDVAALDANVHTVETYDLSIEDSVHRDQAADQSLGFRIGRMLARHVFSASGIGGPPTVSTVTKTSPVSVRVVLTIPTGETVTKPTWVAGWRATDTHDETGLRIARIEWVDSNKFDLFLHDGATGDIRIEAPYDLAEGFSVDGLIRTTEADNNHAPGFALQTFAGIAS
jgi:lysophospholipase L1-like esterase